MTAGNTGSGLWSDMGAPASPQGGSIVRLLVLTMLIASFCLPYALAAPISHPNLLLHRHAIEQVKAKIGKYPWAAAALEKTREQALKESSYLNAALRAGRPSQRRAEDRELARMKGAAARGEVYAARTRIGDEERREFRARLAEELTNRLPKSPQREGIPRGAVFAERKAIAPEERAAFRGAQKRARTSLALRAQWRSHAEPKRMHRSEIERQKMRRALVALGYLTIRKRRVTLGLNSHLAASIS